MTTKTISVKVDSGNSAQKVGELDKSMVGLGSSANKANSEILKLNKSTEAIRASSDAAGGAFKGLGRNAGQASIQVQQFVGQVQGGQSALLALSQQSADLGIVLGAPLIGTFVALGASLLSFGLALNETTDDFKEFSEESEKAQEKLLEFIRTTDQASRTAATVVAVSELNREYEKLSQTIADLEEKNAQLQKSGQVNAQASVVAQKLIDKNNQKIKEAQKQQEILSERISEAADVSIEASAKINAETQKEIDKRIERVNVEIELQRKLNETVQLTAAREKLKTEQIRQEVEARQAFYSGEITQQQLNEEIALQNLFFAYENRRNAILGNERLTAEQKAILISTLAEQEIAAEEALQLRLTQAAQKGAQDRANVQKWESTQVLSAVGSSLNALANLQSKNFKREKKLRKAAVIVNTASAVMKTWEANGGYPYAIAPAAAMAATGLAQLNAINSASANGGGSIDSSTPAPTPAAQPAQQQQQSSTFEILGLDTLIGELRESNGVLSTDAVANMFESFRQAGQNGANTSLGG